MSCLCPTTRELIDTLDFNADKNGEDERQLIGRVEAQMETADQQLSTLEQYAGCEEAIRDALNDPGDKTEKAAWKAVSHAVEDLYTFYQFSNTLGEIWPEILEFISTGESPRMQAESHPATLRKISEIFSFVFHFDSMKMVNPSIQNDFSYYRRTLNRKKRKRVTVDEDLANKMSFFFAYPTPMMKVLNDAGQEMDNKEPVVEALSYLANACYGKLASDPSEHTMLYLCGMTGAIILIDHLDIEGVFHKRSPVMIKECIQLLTTFEEENTDFLVNSLRFTTMHLLEESTISAVTKMLT
eukprot:TRINITY_DN2275_c0_g2_i1.p1 TRINITY_DN2275_c0_g2~~TRINITY_DN2275_c0_g2_i1.p1  ORF type:complete len:298 (-),score=78.25 TRINITY_DN2275_c0_g2_i1:84-977(-)